MNKAVDNLILIGMPGAGKSTVGHRLAEVLGWSFLDTDGLIEAAGGGRLQDILDRLGLKDFLELEAATVRSLNSGGGRIIATGGSVVYSEAAMDHLGRLGELIWLDADLEELAARLAANIGGRGVAMGPGQSLADLFAERRGLYKRYGRVRIVMTGKTVDEVAAEIRERVFAGLT